MDKLVWCLNIILNISNEFSKCFLGDYIDKVSEKKWRTFQLYMCLNVFHALFHCTTAKKGLVLVK